MAAMAASRAAIPSLDPYIVAEAAQGVAYRALPSPKGSVLNAVSTTVSDLNTRFEQVLSHSWTSALQAQDTPDGTIGRISHKNGLGDNHNIGCPGTIVVCATCMALLCRCSSAEFQTAEKIVWQMFV